MKLAAARREATKPSEQNTLSDHISDAIDELLQLQPIAAGWRSANATADLIDDINRIGKRLARVGRR